MFPKILLLISFTTLFFGFATADCPTGTYSIPSNLGSRYNCVNTTTTLAYFAEAEQVCSYANGHLMPIPNGYVNSFLIGKALILDYFTIENYRSYRAIGRQ